MSEEQKEMQSKISEEKKSVSREQEVFTMPKRFLGAEPGQKPIEQTAITNAPIKKKFPLIPVVIVGIIIVVGGGVGYYFLSKNGELPEIVKREPEVVIPPSIGEGEEEPEEVATSTPKEDEEDLPQEVLLDADSDGLTDTEEGLYGSDINNKDSDGDTHLDGHEVFHLYNPVGTTPSSLIETGSVKEFTSSQFGYHIYYPSAWSPQVLDGVTGSVMFSSGTGEFIEVLIEQNTNNLPIVSWYLTQAPGVRAGDLETFVAKSGLDGIKSPDRLTAYFTKNGLVYIISYNIGAKTDLLYKRTFEMMLNSFKVTN